MFLEKKQDVPHLHGHTNGPIHRGPLKKLFLDANESKYIIEQAIKVNYTGIGLPSLPNLNILQTTHVAAQYGQTAFLYHIVTKWNADPDIPDNEGRSPLHWYLNFFLIYNKGLMLDKTN